MSLKNVAQKCGIIADFRTLVEDFERLIEFCLWNKTVTNCHQLKLRAADGKMRQTEKLLLVSNIRRVPFSVFG